MWNTGKVDWCRGMPGAPIMRINTTWPSKHSNAWMLARKKNKWNVRMDYRTLPLQISVHHCIQQRDDQHNLIRTSRAGFEQDRGTAIFMQFFSIHCWCSITIHFKRQFELKILTIKISCLHILSKLGRLHVSTRKYCYIGIWAEMQVKHELQATKSDQSEHVI